MTIQHTPSNHYSMNHSLLTLMILSLSRNHWRHIGSAPGTSSLSHRNPSDCPEVVTKTLLDRIQRWWERVTLKLDTRLMHVISVDWRHHFPRQMPKHLLLIQKIPKPSAYRNLRAVGTLGSLYFESFSSSLDGFMHPWLLLDYRQKCGN